MKKFLALLLAVLMVLSMAACNQDEQPKQTEGEKTPAQTQPKETEATEPKPKEPVTITYWYANNVGEQQYTEQVEEKLAQILDGIEGYEHITMDLRPMGKGVAQNFTLAQSGGEQIDLVSLYSLDPTTMVQNGDLIPLDDLLAKYPNVTSELPGWLVDMGKLWGEQYFIPTYQQATTMYYWQFPADYLDIYLTEKRITKDQFRETLQCGILKVVFDTLEDFTLTVREKTGKTLYCSGSTELALYLSQEYLGSNYGDLVLREGETEVKWNGLTEDVKYIVSRLADWYERGLVHPDMGTIKEKEIRKLWGEDGSMAYHYNANVATEEMMDEIYAAENLVSIQCRDHYYVPSVYAAKGVGIYADCEHPEEAMMILELLNTEKGKEFYNTLVWGLEDIHWKWVDQDAGRIETLEYSGSQGGSTSSYHAWKWNVGNSFNAWDNQASRPGQNEYILSVHDGETTVTSPAMGMVWDLSEVSNEVAQCNAIKTEYSYVSMYISGDWEARYNEMVDKLKTAGVQTIIDNLQAQFDEFVSNKK